MHVPERCIEDGQIVGTSQNDRIGLTAGTHRFELVNEALGFRTTRVVQVVKGKGTSIKVEFPQGSIAINAMVAM